MEVETPCFFCEMEMMVKCGGMVLILTKIQKVVLLAVGQSTEKSSCERDSQKSKMTK
jgi:hypothetical protein